MSVNGLISGSGLTEFSVDGIIEAASHTLDRLLHRFVSIFSFALDSMV